MGEVKITLLCVGTELLRGQLNTHVPHIAEALESGGFFLSDQVTVPDRLPQIRGAFKASLKISDVVISTGGLGPTFDDLTAEALSQALRIPLRFRPGEYRKIRAKFRRYRLRAGPENKKEARILKTARVFDNKRGSAPAQFVQIKSPGVPAKLVFLLPGPLRELAPILENQVVAAIRRRYPAGRARGKKVFHLAGVTESAAGEKLAKIAAAAGDGLEFTILGSIAKVDIHVFAQAPDRRRLRRRLMRAQRAIAKSLGSYLVAQGPKTLESAVGALLRKRGASLSAAESCTGGLFTDRLTDVPGSSKYFLGSVVAYSNEAKRRELRVRAATLARHGAVSRRCAAEMARGAQRAFGTDYAVAITGIAGPGGASSRKPAGLAYVALSRPNGTVCVQKSVFPGERRVVKERAVSAAFNLLRRELLRREHGAPRRPES